MKQLILIGVIIFLTLTLLFYVFQRHLLYSPAREAPLLNDYQANDMQIIKLHTQDGLELSSWYKPAQGDHPTLLYFHGNAGNISGRMTLARQFMDAGLGVLLLEYRGYGGNQGSPTEEGLYEDARTALRFLHSQSIQRIVVYGESLGTGVATKLASEHAFCAVILQSPFTSITDVARYHYPWILLRPWDRFNSLERIQKIHAPLLILHGLKDNIVPYSQGQALFQQALEPKKMLSYSIEGHNTIWNAPGFAKNVTDFIDSVCTL